MIIDLQWFKDYIRVQSRSLNNKTHRRDTSSKMVKYLAFRYLSLTLNPYTYVKYSKKRSTLPNKFPNEF